MQLFTVPLLLNQLIAGIVNGALYACLSLGLALIFGLLNIPNFAHGAFYMLGAVGAWWFLHAFGLNYWFALALSPILVGLIGILVERLLLRRLSKLDHLYAMLLTFGLAVVFEASIRIIFPTSGFPYRIPELLRGGVSIGAVYIPMYRLWVIVAAIVMSGLTWWFIERTSLGSLLRATMENASLVQALGVRSSTLVMWVYGAGVALAAFAGVLAAPILQVSADMGSNILITVFAIVVIGGLGSIRGTIITGFLLGLIEGVAKTFAPQYSSVSAFVFMAIVLLLRPNGLFGSNVKIHSTSFALPRLRRETRASNYGIGLAISAVFLFAGFFIYPQFVMKVMIFGIFACAYNLMAGYGRLISFGHAMFLGGAGYITGYVVNAWGWPPGLAILSGVAISSLLGLIVGWLSVRTQGIYFAMVTLAFAQIVYFLATQMPFTGGEDGLQNVAQGKLFRFFDLSQTSELYGLVFVCFVTTIVFLYMLTRSPFGLILCAIREHEPRVKSFGFDTNKYVVLTFVISAALSGLAGSLKVVVTQIATLTDVYWLTSGTVIFMVFVGGVGTTWGPVLGALIVVAMETYFASLGNWVLLLYGAIMCLCMLIFRHGIVGELINQWNVRRSRDHVGGVTISTGTSTG